MQDVSLSMADVLCVYGIPNSALSQELIEWVNENEGRYVAVIEDVESDMLSFSSPHDRIKVYGASPGAFTKIAWEYVFLSFDCSERLGNEKKSMDVAKELFSKLCFYQDEAMLIASDYKERGIDIFQNILRNSLLFPKSYDGKAFFGKFSQVPAIICGAGTSLDRAIDELNDLGNKALIFAGGSALAALSKLGVQPHFGGIIDPHPPQERMFSQMVCETPLLYQSRAHPSILPMFQGPLLQVAGSGNDFFQTDIFEGGWNVSTFLTALACHMGCSPIILVGVDLAQEKDAPYAGDLDRSEGGELIPLENGRYTRRDWLFAADWFAKFAKNHPEVEWINASRGLEINGFEKRAIGDILLKRHYDLSSMIHTLISEIPMGVQKNFSQDAIRQSLYRVGELCERIVALLGDIFPTPPEKNGQYALLQLEIEKEPAFTAFLEPVWKVWKYVIARQIARDFPKEIPMEYGLGLNQWLFMKGICDETAI